MRISERVAEFIEQEALLRAGQSVVVGVSGGPDSLCLLDCLHRLHYRPVVAHFDHQLRQDSAQDAEFVRQVASSYDLPFELGQGSPEHSSEESARLSRYTFLRDVASRQGVERIAVGHTASDQAETVLMHLIRGAGSSGLRGMLPITHFSHLDGSQDGSTTLIIRPLLEIWRHETESYCAEHELAARTDPSNQDLTFFRNRLRNELMPELRTYNPRIQEVLLRTAKVMAADSEIIDRLVDAHWIDWVNSAGEGVLAIQMGVLFQEPRALQRAAVRRAIAQLVPEIRDVGFDTVEHALQSMREGKRRTLLGGLDLIPLNGEAYLRTSGALIVLPEVPQFNFDGAQQLSLPFEVELGRGWTLTGVESERAGDIPGAPDEAWFDASAISEELSIRAPRLGDRIAPLGMSGSMKLSDLFVNKKVPWLARERWPLIACGDQIIWVPGLHRADYALVNSTTRNIVRMRLEKPVKIKASS
ncbi:MAG: tRNA lysidine(34) synthetase TilS [Anaerolineales bacterium]